MKEALNDVVSLRGSPFRNVPKFGESIQRVCGTIVGTAWYFEAVSSEVDITLIQETLALTPQQRLQQNDRVLRVIEELRDGFAKSRKPARDASHERH